MNTLESVTRGTRDAGRKLLVPYVTGGITEDWTSYVRAVERAGADVIEVGLPFSDPMLDGPTIQQASDQALRRGSTVDTILAELSEAGSAVPLVAMTYANLVFHRGAERFCSRLRDAGVSGLIVPDVPVDEVAPLREAARNNDVALVLLAAPSTGAARRRQIGEASRGFVYAVSRMSTTGERGDLTDTGRELVLDLKRHTDLPVLLGFGVSTPEQVTAAADYADGVVVASALMRRVLTGAGAEEIGAQVAAMRDALDAAEGTSADGEAGWSIPRGAERSTR
ncbi:tryptophan synthase subunit alpha [Pseudonocardia spinosispora]|uniref:tryptophan synthase subunit alpha n=1 Tax=Pseudonocardia spinosispora TaxID=103441 RepID=UPI00040F1871|nr:tryptophan synthase subunit alpha [Pseudonocardia spinosispora]